MDDVETVLLAGNGAVEGGWPPVEAALRRAYAEMKGFFIGKPEAALADLVFRLRYLHLKRGAYREAGIDEMDPRVKGSVEAIKMYTDLINAMKRLIAEEITAAVKWERLRPRRETLVEIQKSYLGKRFAVITTNWETSLEDFTNEAGVQPPVYLHGNVRDPLTLYLPSELTLDPHWEPEAKGILIDSHQAAVNFVEGAKRIVIYGLSLSPLDAEVGALFVRRPSWPGPGDVIVIDINPDPVVERLRFLFQMPGVVRSFYPEELMRDHSLGPAS